MPDVGVPIDLPQVLIAQGCYRDFDGDRLCHGGRRLSRRHLHIHACPGQGGRRILVLATAVAAAVVGWVCLARRYIRVTVPTPPTQVADLLSDAVADGRSVTAANLALLAQERSRHARTTCAMCSDK